MTNITLLPALPGFTSLIRSSFALLSFLLVNNSFSPVQCSGVALQRMNLLRLLRDRFCSFALETSLDFSSNFLRNPLYSSGKRLVESHSSRLLDRPRSPTSRISHGLAFHDIGRSKRALSLFLFLSLLSFPLHSSFMAQPSRESL